MADTIKSKDLNQPVRQMNQPRPQGTGFTNIQRIIGANQGNKLGQAVSGGIQKTGQQATQNLNSANQQFQQQVGENTLDTQANKDTQNQLLNKATGGQDLSSNDISQAAKFRAGQYSGPTDLQNSNLLMGQATEAEQLGKLGGSEGGRQGLLQRFVGKPQYSQGQQKLDTLLLGANSNAINQARASTQGLSDQALRRIEGARALGQQTAQNAQQFGQDFTNTLASKTGDINTNVQNALSAAQAKDTANQTGFQNLRNDLSKAYNAPAGIGTGETADSRAMAVIQNNPAISDQMKGQLSQIIQQSAQIGVDPTTAINNLLQLNTSQNANTAGITTAQQAASLNALAKLSGQPTTDYGTVGNYKAGGIGYKTPDSFLNTQQQLGNINKQFGAPKSAFQDYLAGKDTQQERAQLNQLLTPEDKAQLQAAQGTNDAAYNSALKNILNSKSQAALAAMQKFENGE